MYNRTKKTVQRLFRTMKKQLVTSVDVAGVPRGFDGLMELCVIGEVYYTRRTKILKRLVRKVIHKVEVPLDYFTSVEAAKAEARRQMDAYVKEYYRNH